MQRLRLALEYFHAWTNDAGYHVAAATGAYRDVGIELRQVVADPLLGDSLHHLLDGAADLAVAPVNRVFVQRAAGRPVVALAAVNHRPLETLMTTRSSGIHRPRDLEGRRVALNPTPRGRAMLEHLVGVDGGDPTALCLVDTGTREIVVDDLVDGLADAFFGAYWAWDALFGATPEDERLVWPIDELGAPRFHPYVLVTTERTVLESAAVLRGFLAATEHGFRVAGGDPETTLAVLDRSLPFVRRSVVARSLELLAPTWFIDGRWGTQLEIWHAGYAAWLAERGALEDPAAWKGVLVANLESP